MPRRGIYFCVLIFQVRVFPLSEREIRFDMYFSDERFLCYVRTSNSYSRDGKAAQGNKGQEVAVALSESGEYYVFSFEAPLQEFLQLKKSETEHEPNLSVCARIYKNSHASIFHECFAFSMNILLLK